MPLSEWRAEWPPVDQALLLALLLNDADDCSGCGQPLSETTAKGASGRYSLREHLCAGCEVAAAAAKDRDYPGRLVQVVRKPD